MAGGNSPMAINFYIFILIPQFCNYHSTAPFIVGPLYPQALTAIYPIPMGYQQLIQFLSQCRNGPMGLWTNKPSEIGLGPKEMSCKREDDGRERKNSGLRNRQEAHLSKEQ